MKQLTGAQIVLECLKEQGVDTVFGYPGGAILNIYDELYKQKKDFTHILTSHEQPVDRERQISLQDLQQRIWIQCQLLRSHVT